MKVNKISSLIFSVIALIAICLSVFMAVPVFSTNADSALGTKAIDVQVLNSEGRQLNGVPQQSFNGSPVIRYNWQDAKTFRLSFNFESASILPDSEGNFTYNIRVEYVNEYASDMKSFTDNTKIKTANLYAENQKVQSLSEIETLNIDADNLRESITNQIRSLLSQDNSANDQLKECYGWGVYRFSIVFKIASQDEIASTSYIGLDPTALQGAPVINATEESSKTGIITAWSCYLTNDNIDYIDQSTIRWYVSGITSTGEKYVLTAEDFPKFEGYNNPIWNDAVERNGVSFFFDSNTLSGTWEVYCEVTPHTAPDEAPANPIKSNVLTVETGNKISPTTIIWWIVGGVALLVIIVVIIIVVTKKKEKVW